MSPGSTRGSGRGSASPQTPETASALGSSVRVVSGNPTAQELAAVIAVIEGMTQELAGTRAKAVERAASAWRLSQRPIRTPLVRGVTRWGGLD